MMKLFLTAADAKEIGMTHEGKIYGVSMWMRDVNSDSPMACPKFLPAQLWLWFASWAYDMASFLLPRGGQLVTPMSVGRPINQLLESK